MAGRGPSPKPADRRARANKDDTPTTTIAHVRAEQPDLPDGVPWTERTRTWWAMWGDAPQAAGFIATDWDFLLDTALMHHALWAEGDLKMAAEIRLRVAKFGATPEDRSRLRMQFEPAGEPPARRPGPSTQRWGNLRALPAAAEA